MLGKFFKSLTLRCYPNTLRRMWMKLRGDPTIGPRPGSRQEIKDGSSAKDGTLREAQDARQSRSELDPAVDDRKCCKKNSFVSSCIDKRTKEGYDRGSEVRTVRSRLWSVPLDRGNPEKRELWDFASKWSRGCVSVLL